jgi:hypothetical protein
MFLSAITSPLRELANGRRLRNEAAGTCGLFGAAKAAASCRTPKIGPLRAIESVKPIQSLLLEEASQEKRRDGQDSPEATGGAT